MNVAALFAKHKTQLMVGGAGVAVLLGLRAHKTGAAGSAAAPKTTAIAPATYDSTANDLYNSIEPQIGWLAQQLADMKATASSPVASQPGGGGNAPVPVPITTYPAPGYGITNQWAAGQTPPAGVPAGATPTGIPGVWRWGLGGKAAEARDKAADAARRPRLTGSPGAGTSGGVRSA